jgi:hypothetical protein
MNHPGFIWSLDVWARRQVEQVPGHIGAEMLRQRAELIGTLGPKSTSPFAVANRFLTEARKKLMAGRIWRAYDESMIRDCAESWARAASVIPQLTAREEFAQWHGIEPPARKYLSDRYEACAARLADPLWWRRQIRKAWTRASENAVRELGVVRKGKMPYASDEAVAFRAQMKRNARKFQENTVLVNELGEQLGLFEVAQRSIANPALRRGEFMTRVRGFEELAEFRHDVALFFTLTTPSRFHCQMAEGGKNPQFYVEETPQRRRETVRSAQAWLCKQWAKARAALHRRKITIYGFRIAEPHHDGTPHWHGLFFMSPDTADVVSDVITSTWLKDTPWEPGARAHRVRTQKIDPTRGSPAGYIAKYIAKNIDGHGAIGVAGDHETAQPISEGVARVDAWAAIHGIRQFQQIGGPPVGLWREARKLREEIDDVDIERVRRCADRGDWRGFCRAVSCTPTSRQDATVRLWKEETGERSKYGDCRPARTLGLRCSSVTVETRPHRWELRKKGQAGQEADVVIPSGSHLGESGSGPSLESSLHLGPVAITVRPVFRLIPGTRRLIQGRWAQMTFPGQRGAPPFVFVDTAGIIDTRGGEGLVIQ